MKLGNSSPRRPHCAVCTCWFTAFVVIFALQLRGSAADASSQNTVIEGRVSNVGTGGYVGNARISVEGTSLEAFTDSFGFYRLTGVPAGQVNLRVFYTGQSPLTKSVSVPAGQTVQVDFNFGDPKEGDKTVVLSAFSVVANKEMDARAIAINEQRFAPNIKNVVSTDEYGSIAEGNVG